MNKAELKAAWGKYCDTDLLVDQMIAYMSSKKIRHSVNGICAMLNTFFENKSEIIEMLRNSDNYVGNLRVMVDTEMTRYNNVQAISSFVYRFYDSVDAGKILYKKIDDDGKSINDYVKIGVKKVTVDDIVKNNVPKASFGRWNDVFDNDGVTRTSIAKSREFKNVVNCFNRYSSPVVNGTLSASIASYNKDIKIVEGTKTSRAFNKVCHVYGIDSVAKGIAVKIASGAKFTDGSDIPNEYINVALNVKNVNGDNVELSGLKKEVDKKYLSNVRYNKLFAEYSDMVATNKRKIKFYISVNPIDYLTMSVGRSWHSCHAYGGGYFGGTVSYMLDEVSIITFVHDEEPDNFITEGKIYRNMMHYKDGLLLQSRVYPQGNDGCVDLYEEFRKIVQKEISCMLDVKNEWQSVARQGVVRVESIGSHYRDYNYSGNGSNYSRINGSTCDFINIGHINVCPNCGREDPLSYGSISHSNCSAAI